MRLAALVLISLVFPVQLSAHDQPPREGGCSSAAPEQPAASDLPPKSDGAHAGDERNDNGLAMKLVWCPPGKCTMGTAFFDESQKPNEGQANVTLTSGLWLGRTEVTQKQWKGIVGTTPWQNSPDVKERDDYPAVCVNRDEAADFCTRLTDQERKARRLPDGWEYTLPTEAQWEYACRAGTTTTYSFGDDPAQLSDYAWWGGYFGNGNCATEHYAHEVGKKKPNRWGLFDMHGNVWEWCRDSYAGELPGGTDPEVTSDPMSSVIRGGSWSYPAEMSRSATRLRRARSESHTILGFRAALSRVRDAGQKP